MRPSGERQRAFDLRKESKRDAERPQREFCGRCGRSYLADLTRHSWAELVETTDRRTGAGLKEGRASADLTEYYRLGSEMLAASESDAPLNPDTQRRFQELHRLVSPDIA